MEDTPFGRYRLLALLGRGGMGEVWRAHDTETDRIVALKLLPTHLSDDEEFQRRFRREAHAAAQLSDPHVIPIHHYGAIDDRLYVDMRLIEGRDLQSVLADGPLDPARAVHIIEQVATALHAAHEVGLLHRDVKPSNILIDRNDFAYLIDFGIARAVDETRMTKSGNTIGTFQYIAPERLETGTEDTRADIYSLACVLYESLTGTPPFPGDTTARLFNAHLNSPPPRPSINQPNVPAQLDDVIATGMAKDPDQRYSTTVELANAARRALTKASAPTRISDPTKPPAQISARLDPDVQPPTPATPIQPDTETTTSSSRSKRKWFIAAAIVLLAAVVGAALVLHNVLSPSGGEVVLSSATDPGENPFMPPVATPPPTNAQPPPTLQPQGDGGTMETQPLPGNRDGLYGGTLNNAELDREKLINFLSTHPAQASAFVDALNTDTTLFWSGGHPLTVADIPTYLRELTPGVLRLDTRITNHGFDGTRFTTLQSVFQAGTAVLVDAHGVPRTRGYSGSPLTAPIALAGRPKTVGKPWPGYRSGALAAVRPSPAAITNFVLVDIVTGNAFNRPAGTTGTNDTPHTQPVAAPEPPASTTPTTGQGPQPPIDGTYMLQVLTYECGGAEGTHAQVPVNVTLKGNTLWMAWNNMTGTLNADGSFVATGTDGMTAHGSVTTEGGRTVIRGEDTGLGCDRTWVATKQ